MRSVSPALKCCLVAVLIITGCFSINSAQSSKTNGVKPKPTKAAPLSEPVEQNESEMRAAIERYTVDRGSLQRSFPVATSPARRERFRNLYNDRLASLQKLDFDSMSQDGKIDYILFRNHLEYELRQLDIQAKQLDEIQPLVPFAKTIIDFEETRRRMEPIDSAKIAATLNDLKKQVDARLTAAEAALKPSRGGDTAVPTDALRVKKTVANRAVGAINGLRNTLRNWYTFYNGYDPVFTWWNEEPYKALDQSLTTYAQFLSERVVGIRTEGTGQAQGGRGPGGGGSGAGAGAGAGAGGGQGGGFQRSTSAAARPGDTSDIVGDPIGREALISELRSEMIPYTPEEIIAIGEKEMAWCENEMKKASRELGFGDDWHKALEEVKNRYVEPGKQPEMIRELAFEAIKFVEDNNLV